MKTNAALSYSESFDSLESEGSSVHYPSVSDAGVDIRVDGIGGSSGGTCDVLVDGGVWEACVHIEPGAPCDLLMPQASFSHVRFSRAPKSSRYPFEAKLVPIEWKEGFKPTAGSPDITAVQLGVHYEYAPNVTPDSVPWHESVSEDDVHGMALELGQGGDYEVWISLRDPDDSQQWLALFTIVRPGDGDPTVA
jgi:hypothetical protein